MTEVDEEKRYSFVIGPMRSGSENPDDSNAQSRNLAKSVTME
ncbi:MAG: hypothetical protein WCP07_10850 [bacterium]|jgi:hypothetical protein